MIADDTFIDLSDEVRDFDGDFFDFGGLDAVRSLVVRRYRRGRLGPTSRTQQYHLGSRFP